MRLRELQNSSDRKNQKTVLRFVENIYTGGCFLVLYAGSMILQDCVRLRPVINKCLPEIIPEVKKSHLTNCLDLGFLGLELLFKYL